MVEDTAGETGIGFFASLVTALAEAMRLPNTARTRNVCRLILVRDGIRELYPADYELSGMNAISYMGVALFEAKGEEVLWQTGVLDTRPGPGNRGARPDLSDLCNRAGAELRRMKLEPENQESRTAKAGARRIHLRRAFIYGSDRAAVETHRV